MVDKTESNEGHYLYEAILECDDKFCNLGDMIGDNGGEGNASRTKVRCF